MIKPLFLAAPVLAALALLGPAGAARAAAPEPQHIVVPAYWFQNTPSWAELASDDPVSGHDGTLTAADAILNPCAPDGQTCSPGDKVNPAVRKNMRQGEAAGITFYGYVATNYATGTVTVAQAEKEVREYHNWYGLNDIFFDEAATSCGKEKSYYLKLYQYVHQTFGGSVILNPGTTTSSCYMAASDMIDLFEGDQAALSSWTPPGWMAGYPASRFIAIVYGVAGTPAMSSALGTVGADGFGNAYVTDQALPNPYAQLPSYWAAEASDVSGG